MKTQIILTTLILAPFLLFSQTNDCNPMENPDYTNDPYCDPVFDPPCDLTMDCSNINMPPFQDLLDDVAGMNGDDEIIGGITNDEIEGEEPVDGISNDQIAGLGNFFNTNFDIGGIVDCINLDCFYDEKIDSIIGELNNNPTDYAQDFLDALNNEETIAILQDLPENQGVNVGDIINNAGANDIDLSELEEILASNSLDELAEIFFNGSHNSGGANYPCEGNDPQPLTQGDYTDAELDLFSQQIIGLSESQSSPASPSPSSLKNDISTSVDLSLIHISEPTRPY